MASSSLPLNQTLDIAPDQVESMWQNRLSFKGYKPSQVGITSDEKWLLKRMLYPGGHKDIELGSASASQVCSVAAHEMTRLQQLGINVISHAHVLSTDSRFIFTVTPYIPNRMDCERDEFRQIIAPLLAVYMENTVATGGNFLHDIDRRAQYSKLYSEGTPFLHDMEPLCSNLKEEANASLLWLSGVMMRGE